MCNCYKNAPAPPPRKIVPACRTTPSLPLSPAIKTHSHPRKSNGGMNAILAVKQTHSYPRKSNACRIQSSPLTATPPDAQPTPARPRRYHNAAGHRLRTSNHEGAGPSSHAGPHRQTPGQRTVPTLRINKHAFHYNPLAVALTAAYVNPVSPFHGNVTNGKKHRAILSTSVTTVSPTQASPPRIYEQTPHANRLSPFPTQL